MWSWIKRKFRQGTDFVLNPIRRKLSRDWELTSLYRFDNFIETIGVVGVLTFYATLITGALIGILSWVGAVPVLVVWLNYAFFCIGLPNFGILLCLVGISKYIEKFRRTNTSDAVYWTVRRATKVGDVLFRMMVYVLVLYLIIVVIIALGYFAPAIFVGETLYFMSALGALVKVEIFSWFAWVMSTVPWMNFFFQRFRQRLVEAENVALWNRRNREESSVNRGSMEDYADEDDILDCRLERLGL